MNERVRQIVAVIDSLDLVPEPIEQRKLPEPDSGQVIVEQLGRGRDLLARPAREREVMPRSSRAQSSWPGVLCSRPSSAPRMRRRSPRSKAARGPRESRSRARPGRGTRTRARMRATLGREAGSLEPAKDRRVLLHAGERPRSGKHSSHPARPVPTIDPKHPEVERHHVSHLDAVAILQMPAQTVRAQWFKHPSRTIPAGRLSRQWPRPPAWVARTRW